MLSDNLSNKTTEQDKLMTKFTNLEIEILMDRPSDCISEVLCEFYTDEMVTKYGNYNKTDKIIT